MLMNNLNKYYTQIKKKYFFICMTQLKEGYIK